MKNLFNNIMNIAMVVLNIVAVIIAVFVVIIGIDTFKGYNKAMEEHKNREYKQYMLSGYNDGGSAWVDEEGEEWIYRTEEVSEVAVYDGMPVFLFFNDNGTPDDRYDDEIIGILYDRETAIYDELETSLSEAFELSREGNNIRISGMKGEK